MIIELHAIQTFGPSNLNRDDTGNPKEALFGGVSRARVSSQATKRAIRMSDIFANATQVPIGTRTKRAVEGVSEILVKEGIDKEIATKWTSDIIADLFAKLDKKSPEKTTVLLYISQQELTEIAKQIFDALQSGIDPDVKAINKQLSKAFEKRTSAPDIALFGRMLAESPKLSLDAACQVAHALSTHEVNTAEFDYYTAVDDRNPDDTSGAGMLGLIPFNSATYYRCARIDWEQLVTNLEDEALALQTVAAFMQGFAIVVPSGMKNSFINQHKPDFLLAVLRPNNDGQSLLNAFEKPVRLKKHDSGFVEPSIEKFCKYWDNIESTFRMTTPLLSALNPKQIELSSEELDSAVQANLGTWIDVILNGLRG